MQSKTQSQIQILLRSLLPKLDWKKYKGQNGKVGVIGGSKEYTGAPYYSAISSLKAGADLSHIFCTKEASIPIKSYSPEFIVHPILENSQELIKWFPALYTIVIGPGLGREEETAIVLEDILKEMLQNEELKLIGDGDFLWFLSNSKHKDSLMSLVKQLRSRVVLTPNKAEFGRLQEYIYGHVREDQNPKAEDEVKFFEDNINTFGRLDSMSQLGKGVASLASELNNILILRKGIIDIISDGFKTYYVAIEGGLKRCGGQGDVLAGVLGTFAYFQQNLEHEYYQESDRMMLSSVAASIVARKASSLGYKKKKLGLVTPDIIEKIPDVLKEYYDQDQTHKL